jgi:hypothetical protein
MDDTKIDAEAMGRLAKALAFICGPEHACTKALAKAAASKSDVDVKAARTVFLRLKPGDRAAAFSMLKDD